MGWVVVNEREAAISWDQWAGSMPFSSPFQGYAIGQYSKQIGATPYYCAYFDDAGIVGAMALCTLKAKAWKAAIFACNGGPMGDMELWAGLPDALRQASGFRFVYLRIRSDLEHQETDEALLLQTRWSRTSTTSGSSRTMVLDISRSLDAIKLGLSGSWRRDLKIALSGNPEYVVNAALDPTELYAIMSAMVATKQFASTISEAHIRALLNHHGSNIVFVSVADSQGAIIAFRCAFVLGNRAVDFIAATSKAGRDLRASFGALWHEVVALRDLGVTDLDLGGIDPDANPGVYNFKARTGAIERKLLGEFEIANSAALPGFVNLALRARELKFQVRQ